MKNTLLIYMLVIAAALTVFAGCTSSTTNVRTNPGYDQDYTTQTRSRQATSTTGNSQFPQDVYHPPITLSMLAMDTGEVLKGETYAVVAVVDNPEKRGLKYKWSVEAGVLAALPESRRSEAVSWEQKLRDAKGIPGAKKADPTLLSPSGAASPTAAPDAAAAMPQTPISAPVTPDMSAPKPAPGGQQPPALVTPDKPADRPKPADSIKPVDKPKVEGVQVAMATTRYALLAPEDETGGGETWPEPVEKAADEAAPADNADTRTSGDDAKPAEEEAAENAEARAGEIDEKIKDVTGESGELNGFKPKATEGKLVELPEEPAESEEPKEGDDFLDKAPPLVTIETNQPYILWTPAELGSYTIRCVVLDSKGNEVTPERSFPVTVSEPMPKSKLAWNTTQKLNEDDFLVTEVRLENITNYSKGLFTIAYDPAKLSFRLVEPGSFFSKDAKTSLYYAQPPGSPGRVTLAISVDQLGLPKGDGVAARVIFKVKENILDPASLDITQVTTEESRYILDAEGKNILPATPDTPIYATEWTEPPAPPVQERAGATGSQLPATPEPPTSSKRDQLMSSAQSGTPSASTSTPLPSQPGTPQTPAQNPQLQVLEAQRRALIEDQSLTTEQRTQRLAEIEQRIQDLLKGSK